MAQLQTKLETSNSYFKLKTELFEFQKKVVEKLRKIKVGALYLEMGTGKTRTALELIKLRLETGKIDNILWLCPCSVKEDLRRELKKHLDDISMIHIYGIETLSSSDRTNWKLLRMVKSGRTLFIVDESNLVKNHRAIRTQNIIRLAEYCSYKLILNGTPISRNEKDLYSQWYILDWRILGYQSFWSFAANHLEYDTRIKGKIVRTLNIDYLVRKIAPYSYQLKKSECLELPEKTYENTYYDLTHEQRCHYSDVFDELLGSVNELKPHTIYRLFAALQNVIAGFRVRIEDEHLVKELFFEEPLNNPRVQKLLGILNADRKTIIFCKYTYEIETITKLLNDKYGDGAAVPFYGELSQKKRQENLNRFREGSNFLVANKSCAGYGLNLQFCSYVVYYSNDWDYATRVQSEDRVHRVGQENNVHFVDICAISTLDERILDCLERKENLLSKFKEELEAHKDRSTVEKFIYYKDYKGRTKIKGSVTVDLEPIDELKEEKIMETRAYFTKNIDNKFNYIRTLMKEANYSNVIYFCPKKYKNLAENNLKSEKIHIFHYEDINKTNRPYDLANSESLLILDGSARYKNITGYVFKRLEKLALIPEHKVIVDIVPFTTDIMYTYIPFSHLKRQILGHQHWYAFRENNMEYNSKGELVEGHDYELLAEKMVPYTTIDYPNFMECSTETLFCDITPEEQKEYDEYRDKLFEEYESIQPVLTRLADFVNTRKSRYDHLYNLVKNLKGNTIVYTNIKSHNSVIKKLLKEFENIQVKTFYDNNESEALADNIILAEVPIVKNYLFLDVIANAKKDANFYFITGHTTIDDFLYKKMFDEFTQIDNFTKILSKKVNQ